MSTGTSPTQVFDELDDAPAQRRRAAPHTVQMNVMASIGKSSFAVFLYHTGGADRKNGQ